MNAPHVALIGFGEVGVTIANCLEARGVTLAAWDIQFSDPASGPSQAVAARNVRCAQGPDDAVHDAGLVISAVTAAETVAAAKACAPAMGRDAYFLDLNSASPDSKRLAARQINAAGARYVEAAVMSPIQPRGLAAPLLLGGPHGETFVALAAGLGFSSVQPVSREYGVAAATKLCRSIIVKGMEALLAESMVTAHHYGVGSSVLASLTDLFPGADWPQLTRYMISRAIEHGGRRAEEMREAARMVAAAEIQPLLSEAIAARQEWCAGLKRSDQSALSAYLHDILEL